MVDTTIINAGEKYVNGLGITRASDSALIMAAGQARNSSNVNDIVLAAAVTNNGGSTGANGVDVAALANSSLYAVYVIGDSTKFKATASLLSLDVLQPALPGGYDMFRRVGWVRTDGTADLLEFHQYGEGVERTYYYDVGILELNAGASATYAQVDLSLAVPPIVTEVLFDTLYTPNGATDVAEFIPFGSVATNGVVRIGSGVAGAQVDSVWIPSALDGAGVASIEYKVTSGDTLTMLVTGFRDQLS